MSKLVQQLWLGDSIELCKKFKPGRVDCIITDPPFGVDNLSNMAQTPEGKAHATKIVNDESPEIAIQIFYRVMEQLLPKAAEDADLYIFTAWQVLKEWLVVADNLRQYGFIRKALLVWEKDGPGMGDLNSWGMGSEFIIFCKKGNKERQDQRRNNVLHFPQLRPGELIHPHEKPVPLLESFIKHSTRPGELVVDPFGGSASTLRACMTTGRSCVAIEIDPERHAKAESKLSVGGGIDFD